jgi:glycosyltransferase involved in cell wall biosynthesis
MGLTMSNKIRPTVLLFVGYYLPGFLGGGPIRTIANLVATLGEEFNFKIITSDRDLGDKSPYKNIRVNEWNLVEGTEVYYLSQDATFNEIKNLILNTEYDLIYLNSFFSKKFSVIPYLLYFMGKLEKTPMIIAPRGEFSDGAISIKSWRKKVFIFLIRFLLPVKNFFWHASTVHEKKDILKFFKNPEKIHIATDLPEPKATFEAKKITENLTSLKICFLSRICEMKNLFFVLDVLKLVKVPVELNIFGPKESPEYWESCEELIKKLPENIYVIYHGAVQNNKVKKIIADNDLFFVPSKGENYGHVFVEAFSAGVPVLVSDQTPWKNLESIGVGWDFSLDSKDLFISTIEKLFFSSMESRLVQSNACQKFAHDITNDVDGLNRNRNLFKVSISI